MTAVWDHSRFGGTTLLVLLKLADIADDEGICRYGSTGAQRLAEKCRVDRATVMRHLRKLRDAGELVLIEQGGGRKANRYRIVVDPSHVATGGDLRPVADRDAEGSQDATAPVAPVQQDTCTDTTTDNDAPRTPPDPASQAASTGDTPKDTETDPRTDSRIPTTVSRKAVTKAEADLARRILDYWAARTTIAVTGTDVARAIIGRLRTDPDLTPDDHKRIINANLARPFWEGKAPPTVLYGNGKAWASAKAKVGGAGGPRTRHPDQATDHAAARTRDAKRVADAVAAARELEGPDA